MSGWQQRLAIAAVVLVLLGVLLLATRSRHGDVAEPAAGDQPLAAAHSQAHPPAKPAWRAADSSEDRGGSSPEAARIERRHAERSDDTRPEPDMPLPGAPSAPGGSLPGRGVGAGAGADGHGDKAASTGADAVPGGGLSQAATASGVVPRFAAFDQTAGGGAIASTPVEQANVDLSSPPGAYFPPDALLGYPNRGGLQVESGTVMFWVQPVDWDGKDNLAYSFFLLRDTSSLDHHFAILKSQAFLRFQIVNADGVEFDVYSPIMDWQRGEWHHVAATWGDSLMDLWVDGVLVGEENVDGLPSVQANSPAYWGSSRGTSGAGAILADGRIFDSVLSAADIEAEAQRAPQ